MGDSSPDSPISEGVELIADYACETGENPLWHPTEQKLYWCDIPRGRIFLGFARRRWIYQTRSGHRGACSVQLQRP